MSEPPIEERLDELACDFQANASSGILGYIIEETQERATMLREAASVIRRLRELCDESVGSPQYAGLRAEGYWDGVTAVLYEVRAILESSSEEGTKHE